MAQLGMAVFYTAAWAWDYPNTRHTISFDWYKDRGELLWAFALILTTGTIVSKDTESLSAKICRIAAHVQKENTST